MKCIKNWIDFYKKAIFMSSNQLESQLIQGYLMEIQFDNWSFSINFSNRLTAFIREVQQLKCIGFAKAINTKIEKVNTDGVKFHEIGIALKQLGNFFT